MSRPRAGRGRPSRGPTGTRCAAESGRSRSASPHYARSVSQQVRYLGHSTVLVEIDGVRILTDPLLVERIGPLHRHTDAVAHLLQDVDIHAVLISHAHHDHLHVPSLRHV